MLREMRDSLVPGTGRIVIALVLPFKPFVENGWHVRGPDRLTCCSGRVVRQAGGGGGGGRRVLGGAGAVPGCVHRLVAAAVTGAAEDVFAPLGLAVEAVSRTPYLCQGDNFKPYYVLKDTVFVLSQRPA